MTATGSLPPIALEAVAIDCETTGLDAAKARLPEIAAVPLDGEHIGAAPLFVSLADPGVPIPPESNAVHGLDAAAIAGAPPVETVLRAFVEATGRRVVIGHSIGFDLAIINAECQRLGLPPWPPVWVLDLRLASYSLEALAVWRGDELGDRHRATGDAVATAAVFLALLPLLREHGIRTLAEAEAACRQLAEVLDGQHLAGWVEPVASPARRDAERRLARIDAFAYRHRVGELMSSPPLLLPPETTVASLLATFSAARVSAVFVPVREDAAPEHCGIVTERDVLRALDHDGGVVLDRPIASIISLPLETISTEAFAYRAIGRMDRYRIRHLGVHDEQHRLVGAISMRDLLKLRAQEAVNLGDALDEARDVPGLARAWARLPAVAEALLAEGITGVAVAAIVSSEVATLTRRVAEFAETRRAAAGHGPPPRPYTVLVLGSVGRGESLLAMDQDNALIWADGAEPDAAVDPWFAAFGEALADMLHEVGVPYCKGGVMASRPAWRGSLATWRNRIADWVRRSHPEDLLDVDIFFDLRPVFGTAALAETLRETAFAEAGEATGFIKLLAEAGAAGGSPFGLFGALREVDGRVDLKQLGLFKVVTTARCLAVRHGIAARGTGDRLRALLDLGIGGRPDLEAYIEAQALLLELVLRRQLADIAAGDRPGNAIRLDRLERTERHRLKAAIKTLQTAPTSSATCSSPSLVPTAEGPGRPLKARADRNGRRPRRETTRVRRSLRLALPTHYRLCILS